MGKIIIIWNFQISLEGTIFWSFGDRHLPILWVFCTQSKVPSSHAYKQSSLCMLLKLLGINAQAHIKRGEEYVLWKSFQQNFKPHIHAFSPSPSLYTPSHLLIMHLKLKTFCMLYVVKVSPNTHNTSTWIYLRTNCIMQHVCLNAVLEDIISRIVYSFITTTMIDKIKPI